MPVNQIYFQNNVVFGKKHTLLDLKWEEALATTLDVKTLNLKLRWQQKDNHEETHTLNEHTWG